MKRKRRAEAEWIRSQFARAERGLEPEMRGLLEQTPGLLAEAQRRRRAAAASAGMADLVALARRALPRFAVATLVLLATSVALFLATPATVTSSDESATDLEALILEQAEASDGATDWIRHSILGEGEQGG